MSDPRVPSEHSPGGWAPERSGSQGTRPTELASDPVLWTEAFFDEMEGQADPLGDAVVQQLYAQRMVQRFVRSLPDVGTADFDPPDAVGRFMAEHDRLPPWADREQLHLAQELFGQHAVLIIAALFCASLPECYANEREARLLFRTRAFEDSTLHRVRQTGELIFNVMAPNGLGDRAPAGSIGWECGREHALVVRLMHGIMRRLLEGRSMPPEAALDDAFGPKLGPEDPVRTWMEVFSHGVWTGPPSDDSEARAFRPLNQLQLAYTVLTFNFVTIRGLQRIGLRWNRREMDAYMHAWNVVGFLLGVDERLLASSYEHGRILFERIKARVSAASDEGRYLTALLVESMKRIIPWRPIQGVPARTMRLLLGSKTARDLGVPEPSDVSSLVTFGACRIGFTVLGFVPRKIRYLFPLHGLYRQITWDFLHQIRTRETRPYSISLKVMPEQPSRVSRKLFRPIVPAEIEVDVPVPGATMKGAE